jgi:cellobiose-specific phosphotransferase system component IIB
VVFVGPQIRELIQDVKSEGQVSEAENSSMKIIEKLHYQFLGKS